MPARDSFFPAGFRANSEVKIVTCECEDFFLCMRCCWVWDVFRACVHCRNWQIDEQFSFDSLVCQKYSIQVSLFPSNNECCI